MMQRFPSKTLWFWCCDEKNRPFLDLSVKSFISTDKKVYVLYIYASNEVFERVCVCVWVCTRMCVCAQVHACVCACVYCVCVSLCVENTGVCVVMYVHVLMYLCVCACVLKF